MLKSMNNNTKSKTNTKTKSKTTTKTKSKTSATSKTVAGDSTSMIKNFFKNVPSNSNTSVEERASDSRAVYVQALKDRLKSKIFSLPSQFYKYF